MEIVYVTQNFALSGNHMVINSASNLLCYYQFNNEIRWRIDIDSNFLEDGEDCREQISLYNNFDNKNYELLLHIERPRTNEGGLLENWGIHITFAVIALFSMWFMWRELHWQSRAQVRKQRALRKRKSLTKIHFFSNEFENNLRKIESQKRIK